MYTWSSKSPRRNFSHLTDVVPIQNELLEQEQLKQYLSLLEEKRSSHNQFHKFEYTPFPSI